MPTKQEILNRIRARNGKKPTPQESAKVVHLKTKKKEHTKAIVIKEEPEKPAYGEIIKRDIYETYIIWRSIPPMVRKMSEPLRTDFGLVNDDLINQLIDIHTKVKFAEIFGVHRDTLTDWDEKIAQTNEFRRAKKWMRNMTSRILMALATNAARTGNAKEVMTWMKIVEDFNESVTINTTGDVYVLNAGERAQIKQLFIRNAHNR